MHDIKALRFLLSNMLEGSTNTSLTFSPPHVPDKLTMLPIWFWNQTFSPSCFNAVWCLFSTLTCGSATSHTSSKPRQLFRHTGVSMKVKGYHRGYASILFFGCCREKLRQTYEFALDHVGIDFHSGSVWLDFLAFIKEEWVTVSLPTLLDQLNLPGSRMQKFLIWCMLNLKIQKS